MSPPPMSLEQRLAAMSVAASSLGAALTQETSSALHLYAAMVAEIRILQARVQALEVAAAPAIRSLELRDDEPDA